MPDVNDIREIGLLLLERTLLYNKLIEKKTSKNISGIGLEGLEKLGYQQSKVILIIGTIGETIPSNLGLCMNIDRSNLSRMIDSLEKKGIVKRKTDTEDRRKIMISLTEKGEEYYKILQGKAEESQTSIMSSLDEQDIKRYKNCIKTEISIVNKIDSKLDIQG